MVGVDAQWRVMSMAIIWGADNNLFNLSVELSETGIGVEDYSRTRTLCYPQRRSPGRCQNTVATAQFPRKLAKLILSRRHPPAQPGRKKA